MATDNKAARSHLNFTNRKTPKSTPNRAAGGDRRVVFKSVLHNPLQVQWPNVPPATQAQLLTVACEFVQSIGPYYVDRRRKDDKRPRKTSDKSKRKEKKRRSVLDSSVPSVETEPLPGGGNKRKRDDEGEPSQPDEVAQAEGDGERSAKRPRVEEPGEDAEMITGADNLLDNAGAAATAVPAVAPPPVGVPALLAYLSIGINEVTRQLEALTLSRRQSLSSASEVPSAATAAQETVSTPNDDVERTTAEGTADTTNSRPPKALRLILACRYDMDPPLLVSHLPLLVASYNSLLPASSLESTAIFLVPLPKGAEHPLAESLGLRRAAVVGFNVATPGLATLLDSLGPDLKPLTAPWLGNAKTVEFVPTHVKQVKTTAPKDMRRAKEERVAGRAAVKAKKREAKGKKVQPVQGP